MGVSDRNPRSTFFFSLSASSSSTSVRPWRQRCSLQGPFCACKCVSASWIWKVPRTKLLTALRTGPEQVLAARSRTSPGLVTEQARPRSLPPQPEPPLPAPSSERKTLALPSRRWIPFFSGVPSSPLVQHTAPRRRRRRRQARLSLIQGPLLMMIRYERTLLNRSQT